MTHPVKEPKTSLNPGVCEQITSVESSHHELRVVDAGITVRIHFFYEGFKLIVGDSAGFLVPIFYLLLRKNPVPVGIQGFEGFGQFFLVLFTGKIVRQEVVKRLLQLVSVL